MKKYNQAHKYGWYDYLFDLTSAKPDWVMVLVAILLVVIVLVGHELGIIRG